MRRASGSENRQRSHAVAVRLLPEEAALLQEAAERAGHSTGAFLRRMALGNAGPRAVRRPPVGREELSRILGELGRIGSNVNQLAKIANSVHSAPQVAELASIREELMGIRSFVFAALGRQG